MILACVFPFKSHSVYYIVIQLKQIIVKSVDHWLFTFTYLRVVVK